MRGNFVKVVLVSLAPNNVDNLVEGDFGVVLLVRVEVITEDAVVGHLLIIEGGQKWLPTGLLEKAERGSSRILFLRLRIVFLDCFFQMFSKR